MKSGPELPGNRGWTTPLDPSDLDFRIWLAWHDEPARLYVAFVASDDDPATYEPEDSTVDAVSWGRIKASLEME